ncbi:MAG: hypothetical protein QN720_03040 [Nitrososphaeraceae archaeon]|nr:hypothetical protein [Nitrososphaeraceae archaeon]MDW0331933.1 hypothetical protein [Nitrososphaeraceae archaeon]
MSKANQAESRPGLRAGQATELTIIAPLKVGGAERLRKKMSEAFGDPNQKLIDRIGTIHDMRYVIFDNNTRLLFTSTFDGAWDPYIDDFATKIPDTIDMIFGEIEGFPGIRSAGIKDWIVKHQVSSQYFYSAYPDTTVRDVWKAMKIKGGLDVLLDAETS